MPTSSKRMPVRAATSSARVRRISARAPPTFPQPSRATRTVGAGCAWGSACGSGDGCAAAGTAKPYRLHRGMARPCPLLRRRGRAGPRRARGGPRRGRCLGHEDDGRSRHLVVVGGHGVAVGPGDRGGQDVAHLEVVGHEAVGDDEVAALAVLAHHARPGGVAGPRWPGAGTPRTRCRRARAGGCRSCPRRRSHRSGCPGRCLTVPTV